MKTRYPKKDSKGYYWQCAFAECFDHHNVLPGHFYDLLWAYQNKDNSSLRKYYATHGAAIKDLEHVLDLLRRQINELSNLKIMEDI